MLIYTDLRDNRRDFLALTGLVPEEFQFLLSCFTRAYERLYPADQTIQGDARQRLAGGGSKGTLPDPQQKLLFILVYLKTYPLQVVMGQLFGLSQPGVNYWIHRLLPVVQNALEDAGVGPERVPGRFASSQASGPASPRLIIDGTDRRRQRPKNPEKQALHYSGKKKTHSDKNLVIVDVSKGQVDFLSRTYPGRTHDKAIADEQAISYPPGTVLYQDSGFQGYQPAAARTRQPKKSHVAGSSRPPRSRRTESCRASA